MGSGAKMMNNSTMICAPLMAESVEQMVIHMHKAKEQGADVVEVRLDHVVDFNPLRDLAILLQHKPLPVVVVYRPISEGGMYEGEEEIRVDALQIAGELGADYVDFELKVVLDKQVKVNMPSGSKVIVSCHLNGSTPSKEDLDILVGTMQDTGADIIKLVLNVADITEIERVFHLISSCQMPIIATCVGERGFISQILSPKYGGILVYGSLEEKPIPGLPTLQSLRQTYKVDYINADTKVFGLISKPVSHSKGPILHNPSFQHINYDGIYVPMFVDDLKEFFKIYSSRDFAGFSVGIPYKEAVVEFCDEVHPLAKPIGAVNTIIRRPIDGKLIGYNTDCEGAITAIEDALIGTDSLFRLLRKGCANDKLTSISPILGKQFVLVGAGGAGRAIAFGAKTRGARIVIFDIDFNRAKFLASAVSGEVMHFEDLVTFEPEKGAILANATPIGMHPNTDRIPVAEATLKNYQLVFDAVYTPRKTTLLKDAENAGAIIVSGVEMFFRQAVGQFNLFTQGEAPVEFMRELVLAKF
ncbi:hypothetical protein ACFE04_027151 [Oxalis oulophora]